MLLWGTGLKAESEARKSDALVGVGRRKIWRQLKVARIGWAIIKLMAWITSHCFPFLVEYGYKTKVTFGLTNFSGVVGHERYANIFGTAREMFGLSRIPGFSKDVGQKYLLKTCDAVYQHFGDFKFGDIIRTIIDIIEVNGASFRLRGRFVNAKTGEVVAGVYQWITYTNMVGKPTGFPFWLKVLLKLSERSVADITSKRAKDEEAAGFEVLNREIMVTSVMTNAEKNVNHDEYAKIFMQTIDLFFLGLGQRCSLSVREASYRYSNDFFFGDKMVVRLFVVKIQENFVLFEANFCDQAGKIRAYGRQRANLVSQLSG